MVPGSSYSSMSNHRMSHNRMSSNENILQKSTHSAGGRNYHDRYKRQTTELSQISNENPIIDVETRSDYHRGPSNQNEIIIEE